MKIGNDGYGESTVHLLGQPGDIIHGYIEGWCMIDNDMELVPLDEFIKRAVDFEI